MVQLQVISDLHFEAPAAYDLFEITPSAPYLALLGDVGYTKDDAFFDFLRKQILQFQIVFFVLGNHEPYHSSLPEAKARLREFQENTDRDRATSQPELGRFVLLDQTRYDLSPSVTILGCTLFSKITNEQKDYVSFGLNDFYHIKDWDVDQHIAQHESDLAWLNAQVATISQQEPERRIIVLTHYSPTCDGRAIDPKHANGSDISSGFMTDLSHETCMVSKQVVAWAFGHAHFNCDFVLESTGTRIVTSQRGYYFAQAGDFRHWEGYRAMRHEHLTYGISRSDFPILLGLG